ncbi:MAG: hypothetical protein A2888_02125 [Chlamydiae bacterium RIFCSPLOWO2_01_FULL_28_7]|nr:MAG: hypothetical protein A2888_02125 [Chlamydiae bacterium RIFCSPLOWO2_01_FULL_28_7]
MFKKIFKIFKKNPLDKIIKDAKKNNKKRFLLAWNRALGDIPLGLYSVVLKIKENITDAEITFLIREDLKDGFKLLEGINFITVNFWKRYVPIDLYHTLDLLKIDKNKFDIFIENVDPTFCVKWQYGKILPKLKWNDSFDLLSEKFSLPQDKILIAVTPFVETKHSFWRNFTEENFEKLFLESEKNIVFVLLGSKTDFKFNSKNILDLRGKTSILEALSIIKKCLYGIFLDSGLLSLFYYLDIFEPFSLISLWGDDKVGILRQKVNSANFLLKDIKIVKFHDLKNLDKNIILKEIFPNDISDILLKSKNEKILKFFEKLNILEKKEFLKDFFLLDTKSLINQKKYFFKKFELQEEVFPYSKVIYSNIQDYKLGEKILFKNSSAIILMAGGMGSRLQFHKPKALFEINNKSLIEHIFLKILKKQKKYNINFHISLMTSLSTHLEIKNFLKKNNFFGIKEHYVDFFMQKSLPFLDEKGEIFIKDKKILLAPDGNGNIFKNFYKSEIFEKYKYKKIKYLTILPIDNLLQDPFDENLLGFHKKNNFEITIKAFEKNENFKNMGVLGILNKKIKILEYIYQKDKDFNLLNSGIYALNLDFIQKVKDFEIPTHFVMKKAFDNTFLSKGENFIFDNFDKSSNIGVLCDFPDKFFCPLKGQSSIQKISTLVNSVNNVL